MKLEIKQSRQLGNRSSSGSNERYHSRGWIYELVWGYNHIGLESLGEHRHQNPGSKEPLLDDVQQAYLWQALQSPSPEGGQWNGRKVADWIAQLLGRPVGRRARVGVS